MHQIGKDVTKKMTPLFCAYMRRMGVHCTLYFQGAGILYDCYMLVMFYFGSLANLVRGNTVAQL